MAIVSPPRPEQIYWTAYSPVEGDTSPVDALRLEMYAELPVARDHQAHELPDVAPPASTPTRMLGVAGHWYRNITPPRRSRAPRGLADVAFK